MSVQPQYAAMPNIEVAQATAANTNRDGTGMIVTLLTARSPGTRVERVMVRAVGTTTAGMVRIFAKRATADTWRLIKELPVSAITPSATVETWASEWAPTNGLSLADGNMLGVATHNAETFNVFAVGAHL